MEMKLLIALVSVLTILDLSFSSDTEVTSRAGTFSGLTTSISVDGKDFNVRQFLGIPYAEPPVKDLRFKKPVAKQPLKGVYDATYHRAMCPQGGPQLIPLVKFNISEDCLVLNIYAPEKSSVNNSYAVIVYIHGGAFTTGGSNLYIGDVLSAYGEVIVVTFNYRLSILGFLSSGDQTATGNFGLWDQHLAIRWVYENIAAFHGDTEHIIIMGQSSGAVSAINQALYLGNRGLFTGVIAESGTPLTIGSQDTMQPSKALSIGTVGHQVGCSSLFPGEVVACLRNMTWRQIMSELAASFYQMTFSPVVDGEFIRDNPQNILDTSNSNYSDIRKFFSSLNFIIGGNNMEGASYMTYIWKPLLLVTDVENFRVPSRALKSRVIPNIFNHIYHRAPPDYVVDMIAMVYSDITAPDDTIKSRDVLLKLSTDYVFTIPNLKTARLHNDIIANETKTFVYEFTSKSSLVIGKYPTPSWVQGANHGDETGLVFGFSREMLDALNISSEYLPTRKEIVLSKKVMKMWSNFAKSGDPNKPESMPGVPKWDAFTTKTGSYMKFSTNVTEMTMSDDYGQPGGKFWLELMPTFLNSINLSKEQKANVTLSQDREEETDKITVPYTVIVIIVLGILVAFLLIVLIVVCFQHLRGEHKEDIIYNAIEMDDGKRISV